jgi:hypothetical protein
VAPGRAGESAIAFWDSPKRGANFFNEVETRERLRAAREAGLEWVRLVPDKRAGAGRDFLLGDAGDFQGIVPEDLARLKEVLTLAEAEGVPVVMGMLNLPGCRWVQQNGGHQDHRLWNEERYQRQAADFWRELATALKDHSAVVAYNPLNERGWHWAFYSFREDAWDRMDYEVGAGPLGAAYWEAVERGEGPDRPRRDNPLWEVLQHALRAER